MKKLTVILLFGILFAFTAKAQGDWKQIYSEKGITISCMETDCKNQMGHIQHTYLLKFENTNATVKSVEWNYQLIDNTGKCTGCSSNSAEQHRTIKITGNETITADCLPKSRNDIRIAMRFLDIKTAKEIMEVKVVNVNVSDLN
jgi:hypothetical protein